MADTNFNFSIKNMEAIKAAFIKAPELMAAKLNDAIKKSAFAVQRQSMINTPVDTGRLRASHKSLFAPLRAEIVANTGYAVYVHNGTRYVNARPFLLDALQSTDSNIQSFFTDAVDEVLSIIGNAA